MDVFKQWGQYLKIAIPSMLRVCVECWYFELATVAIGTLGSTQLAVMSIIKQLSEIIYMVSYVVRMASIRKELPQIPLGISSAATIRVGNALGAGQPITSQKMSVVSVGYSGITVLTCIPIYWASCILTYWVFLVCILYFDTVLTACIIGVTLFLMKDFIGRLFINDE